MTRYTIEPKTRKFQRITSKNIDFCHLREIYLTNMGKNYSILLQKQDQMLQKLLKKIIHKTAKATGELTGNKIAEKTVQPNLKY